MKHISATASRKLLSGGGDPAPRGGNLAVRVLTPPLFLLRGEGMDVRPLQTRFLILGTGVSLDDTVGLACDSLSRTL